MERTPVWHFLNDGPREVHSLHVAPRSSLMLAPDSLGRVLLVDTCQFLVSHVWKGYRDAQCAWITLDPSTCGMLSTGPGTARLGGKVRGPGGVGVLAMSPGTDWQDAMETLPEEDESEILCE